MKTKTLLVTLAVLLAGAAATAALPAASAGNCKSTSHDTCDAHSCPHNENHNHRHDVKFRRDHYCKSWVSSIPTLDGGSTQVSFAEYGYVFDEIPCTGVPLPVEIEVPVSPVPVPLTAAPRGAAPGLLNSECLEDVTIHVSPIYVTLA